MSRIYLCREGIAGSAMPLNKGAEPTDSDGGGLGIVAITPKPIPYKDGAPMTTWQASVLWLDPKMRRVYLSREYSRNNYRYLVAQGWVALQDV